MVEMDHRSSISVLDVSSVNRIAERAAAPPPPYSPDAVEGEVRVALGPPDATAIGDWEAPPVYKEFASGEEATLALVSDTPEGVAATSAAAAAAFAHAPAAAAATGDAAHVSSPSS
jgi:hypothetical protein